MGEKRYTLAQLHGAWYAGKTAAAQPTEKTPVAKASVKEPSVGLVGKWFHSFETASGHKLVRWQGEILSEQSKGMFLVQLFEWMMGEPSAQQLVRLADMEDWIFYDTSEDMNASYNNGYARSFRLDLLPKAALESIAKERSKS